ncbi:MAG: 30S ribosomal protein S5 [Candidatus Aenigmatarchaeota archaeon]|nr:MAG: 30S ribosomal protein S5 [Candidatus Aenigmarchaeota archaeon]
MTEKEAKEKAEEIEEEVEEALTEDSATAQPGKSQQKTETAESSPEVKQKAGSEDSAPAKSEEAPPGEKEPEVEAGDLEAPAKEEGLKDDERGPPAEKEVEWIPKTKLGNDVLAGKYKSLDDILEKGELILEPEIIDVLIPELMQEVIYIGGSPGKGGGIRRTATKMTARMHKSGRRFKLAALSVVGNGDGIVGIGRAISSEHRTALEKATKNAKLGVIRVRRGCGSWECGCGGSHSVPFRVSGREGSVTVTLIPAPKGVGMVASEEVKKILKIAGIRDVWVKTSGKTETRSNLTMAVFNALKNLNSGKGDL